MKFVNAILKQPHAIAVMGLIMILTGYLGFRTLPLNLFPDVNRPVVSVVTQWPGAAANDVATDVTHPIEVRLSSIDGVRRVTSTSRDEVSMVSVEFEYGIDISAAATDVANELPRVRGILPEGVRDSLIFKITEAAKPVVVLSVTPAESVDLDLDGVRRIASNQLRDAMLNIPDVAEAEVFGGHVRQLAVDIDRNKLEAHGLTIGEVAAALANANVSVPSGLIHNQNRRYLLTAESLASVPEDVAEILVPLPGGDHVRVSDLGTVGWGTEETSAMYRGNGKQSIAVSLLRSEKGHAADVLEKVEAALPGIREKFPMLHIEIADTQGRLINQMVENMLLSLRDAVIMTLIVLFLFLANTRAALITAISLPLSYMLTFATLKVLGYEFNMVTLTAVVIAVGLLADDAVVVIENIDRHMRESGETGMLAAARGTGEILLADTAGTVSTVIVLIPIMFVGGYVQNVLQPLTVTLSVALIASLIVSVTIIPIFASLFLKPGARDPLGWLLAPFTRFLLEPLKQAYASFVKTALGHRALFLIGFAILFVFSARQMKVLGRELMPRMDTGVSLITFEAEPDTDDAEMTRLAAKVEAVVHEEIPKEWIVSTSTVLGSEPGVKSFGAARTLQQGLTTINLIDRFHRTRTIYEIEESIRRRLRRIPGLISANITEFGATPLSSIRGDIDVMISGPDPEVLSSLADEVEARLRNLGGLSGYERTWQLESKRVVLKVDPARARLYGLTAGNVAHQVGAMVGGIPGGRVRVPGENPIPVWVRLPAPQRAADPTIRALPIRVANGSLVPLDSLATLQRSIAPTVETHQALLPTIDVIGNRRDIAVTHLQARVDKALEGLKLPRGYTISQEGTIKEMNDAFTRMGKAFILGLILLYLMLVITFRSFFDPLAIMVTLPLALIGGAWAMTIADKHGCLPSFMGLILLMGIIVNNGILIVDFAKESMKRGQNVHDALIDAVKLRTRPILMTAVASAVGMIPVALQRAVGLERLSPLAVVAIGGLITGTFLTLLVVPIVFSLICGLRSRFGFHPKNAHN
jgi:multidrug efflux pump subunit AcrB